MKCHRLIETLIIAGHIIVISLSMTGFLLLAILLV